MAAQLRTSDALADLLVVAESTVADVVAMTVQTGLSSTVAGAVMIAFGTSGFVARPLLKKHVQR